MKNSGIGLVVIGYASQEVWPTFFESLATSSVIPEAVVVVENSAVAPIGLADLYVPGVTLIHLPENPGYGSGANAGVAALPAHCSRVIICNPDIIWQRESIAELDKALNDNPTVGVAGPKTLNDDGSTYPSARAFPGIRIGIGHALFGELWKSNPWTTQYLGEYGGSAPRIVDWVSGACLMVKRVSFEAIDGFDSGYFMFFEDVDLCFRLKKHQWRSLYVPHAVITHSGAHSTGPKMAEMVKVHHHSAERFLFKLYEGPQYWLLRQLLRAGLAMRSLIAPKRYGTPSARD